jgi:hypothetical protein
MMGGGGGGGGMGGGNLYAAIAQAAVKGATTYLKLKAQKQTLEQQRDMAQANATMADQQARGAIESGRNTVEDYQRNIGGFKSSQINAMAENGLDVTQGSAIDILASTDMMAQGDLENIKYNAAMKSWGFRVEETNFINQRNALDAQAKSVRPRLNAELAAMDQFGSSMMGGGGGSPMQGGESLTGGNTSSVGMNAQNGYKTWSGAEGYQSTSTPSWQNLNWNWMS